MRIECGDSWIDICSYRYKGSIVYPDGRIDADRIEEIDLHAFPPAVKLIDELVYIDKTYDEELKHFAERKGIPLVQRYDIWSDILEPFLDTEITEQMNRASLKRISRYGLSEEKVSDIRNTYSSVMTRYNFIHMDPWHLGHVDLLDALRLSIWGKLNFRRHFRDTMGIALLPYLQMDGAL